MLERRHQDRKYLTFFSRVVDRNSGRMLGYLMDIATNGAQLVGNISIKLHSPISIRVDLPENFDNHECLDLIVIAVWSQPDADPEFYRTGLQLVDPTAEDLDILKRLLVEFGAPPE